MGQIWNTDLSDISRKNGRDHLGGLGSQWSDDAGTFPATFTCLFLQVIPENFQISFCASEN
jgi:hypothetical protein